MKIINKASVVFLVLDDYTKDPLSDAEITCNGVHIPYAKKTDGYYVFLNMDPGNYQFEVSLKGFLPVSYEVELTDVQPMQIVATMQYTQDNIKALGYKRLIFTAKTKGKPVKNKAVRVRLDTKVPFLRVIEPMPKGSNLVMVNSDYNKRLLFQQYSYDKKPNLNIFFVGYDHEKQAFRTRDPFKTRTIEGGLLNPVWNYMTDEHGSFMIPVNPLFIQKEQVDFTVSIEKKNISIVATLSERVSYIDVTI